jgi:N-acetylmuramoyl-L-alanine amidase
VSVWRSIFTLALAGAVALAAPALAQGSARSDYERLLTRVGALRLDGPRPTPRPQMRRVAAEGEAVAKRHAGSGYADNALWQAASVSLAAHRVYRQPADRAHGLELLEQLVRRYPASSLAPQAKALLRKQTTASLQARSTPPPPPAAAPMPIPASLSTPAPLHARGIDTPAATAIAPVITSSTLAPAPASTARLATLRGLRRTTIGDTVRLTVDFDSEVAFDQQRLAGPDRVFFDFARTATISSLSDTVLQFDGPTVRRVRLGTPKADVTRLAIDLDGVATYSVFVLYHPYRLTIDLTPARAALVAAVPAATLAPPPVGLPARLPSPTAAPAPPPAPLRAHRVTTAATVEPMAPPTRIVVVEPLLAAAMPANARYSETALGAAPVIASRPFSRPRALLRAHRIEPLMLRAAVPPPASLAAGTVVGSIPAGADRLAARRDRKPATLASPLTPGPAPATENGSGGFSIARQLGLGVSRIVIDPGHGGKDPGAPGPKTTEAEVVLDVALRVEKILAAERGIEVVLTRRDDTFIPLEERTAIANRHAADLFLSIHANSSRNRKAAGVETYVLNFASNADAEAVAARENATATGSMRNLPDMVRAITQNNKRDESRDLAGAVQESMVTRLRPHNPPLRDLGVKQAPFVVLIGAGMPSVLAEIAFISHDSEGGLLKTEKYRQRIAEALAQAVLRYTRALKPVGTVASQED